MFWWGFGVGVIIGGIVGLGIAACCRVAGTVDDYANKLYYLKYKENDNDNNQSL